MFPLEPLSPGLPPDLAAAFPYLEGCAALRVPQDALHEVRYSAARSAGDWSGPVEEKLSCLA